MKEIEIKGVKYILRNILRNFFVYEEIKGKPFSFGKLIDEYLLFYCTLIANNETFSITFDEFIAVCDECPQLFAVYKSFVISELERQAQAANFDAGKSTKKKKSR